MEDRGWDIRTAMDAFLSSNTFRKLERESTGLYYQSPAYVYEMLTEELQQGEMRE